MEEKRNGKVGRREEDMWTKWDKRVRDALIFAVGFLGSINEVFFVQEPRPSILVFLGSLMGLPIVLRADEARKRVDKDEA